MQSMRCVPFQDYRTHTSKGVNHRWYRDTEITEWGWLRLVRRWVSVLKAASLYVPAILAVWHESIQKFSGPSHLWVSCGRYIVSVNKGLWIPVPPWAAYLLVITAQAGTPAVTEIQGSGFSDQPTFLVRRWTWTSLFCSFCWSWGRAYAPKLCGEGDGRTRTVGRWDFPRRMVNMDIYG